MSGRRAFLKTAGATALGLTLAGCARSTPEGSTESTTRTTGSGSSDTTTSSGSETTAETETTTSGSDDVKGSVGLKSSADLKLTEHSYFESGSDEGVRGTVKNVSDKTFSCRHPRQPRERRGRTLDRFEVDSSESIDKLQPGATWDFEVVFEGDTEFTQYTIWATGQTDGESSG